MELAEEQIWRLFALWQETVFDGETVMNLQFIAKKPQDEWGTAAIWTLTFRLNRSQCACCLSKSHVLVKQVTMMTHSEICLDTALSTERLLEK